MGDRHQSESQRSGELIGMQAGGVIVDMRHGDQFIGHAHSGTIQQYDPFR